LKDGEVLEQAVPAFFQGYPWYPVLVRMPLSTWELGEGRSTDRLFVGTQYAAEVLQLSCGSRLMVLNVVTNGSLDAVHRL
jgi:hypothetical protein